VSIPTQNAIKTTAAAGQPRRREFFDGNTHMDLRARSYAIAAAGALAIIQQNLPRLGFPSFVSTK
jgi:hypothetical protein